MEAKIWNKNGWIKDTTPAELKAKFDNILGGANFNVLGFIDYHFKPFGYTAIWLLGESHFAIHTFPEKEKTYFELSSCNEIKHKTFVEMLERDFKIEG